MKRYRLWIALAAVVLLLSGCFGGNVTAVNRVFGESQIYNKWEIGSAMNVVIRLFKNEFDGCTLTELKYDEEVSEKAGGAWAEHYGADQGIVLVSTFRVDDSGGDGSLNPNSTYKNYQWILTRSDGGAWVLRTWGYG